MRDNHRKSRLCVKSAFALGFAWALSVTAAIAQDSPDGGESTSATTPQPKPNPLAGLWTPQPQYPIVTTPRPAVPEPLPGVHNPLYGLFTPTDQMYGAVHPEPQTGETNVLRGIMTHQPQYPISTTPRPPDPDTSVILKKPYDRSHSHNWLDYMETEDKKELLKEENPPKEEAPKAEEKNKDGKKKGKSDAKAGAKGSKKDIGKTADGKKAGQTGKASDGKAPAETKKAAPPQSKLAPPPSATALPLPTHEALYLMSVKQYKSAIDALDKVLGSDPSNAEAHYLKGVASVYLRNYDQARSEYQSTLNLSPSPALTEKAQAGLNKLRR